MRRILYCLLLPVLVTAFAACSDTSNPTGPGGSPTYFPLTKGSSWTYAGYLAYTTTMLGDSVVNGITWSAFRNTGGGSGLVRRIGTEYFQMDTSGKPDIKLVDEKVGATWSFEFTGANFTPNRQDFETMEDGLKRTVRGKEYSDVMRIHLSTKVFNSSNNTWVSASETDYYYAKNIGLIQSDFGVRGTVDLVSYEIK